ncbi:hypothetical protein ACH5RR_018475 [Cinchona calisaya]|uniref:Uncharacterized protein n=1 Tax=Cinchona calisaya TaxID=153742 RepID=A0ABD2ZLJ4_9GENT
MTVSECADPSNKGKTTMDATSSVYEKFILNWSKQDGYDCWKKNAIDILMHAFPLMDVLLAHQGSFEDTKATTDHDVKSFKEKLKEENIAIFANVERRLDEQTKICSDHEARHITELEKMKTEPQQVSEELEGKARIREIAEGSSL